MTNKWLQITLEVLLIFLILVAIIQKQYFIIGLTLIIFIISQIYTQIQENYLQDDPMINELKKQIEPLFSNQEKFTGKLSCLNDRDIMKEIRIYKGDKSYTINKHKIYMCLKDENDNYYHINNLLNVLIHEISHCLCQSVGHTEEFYDIFNELLKYATDKGVYNSNIPMIDKYCTYNDK